MATNVRLKDAAGNVLHPETDWSVVQNKPSISKNADAINSESWSASQITLHGGFSVKLESELGPIYVTDSNTDKKATSLDNYPISWRAIKNKPSLSEYFYVGVYRSISGNNKKTYSLAYYFWDELSSTYKYYYFDKDGQVHNFTPNSGSNISFISLQNILGNN